MNRTGPKGYGFRDFLRKIKFGFSRFWKCAPYNASGETELDRRSALRRIAQKFLTLLKIFVQVAQKPFVNRQFAQKFFNNCGIFYAICTNVINFSSKCTKFFNIVKKNYANCTNSKKNNQTAAFFRRFAVQFIAFSAFYTKVQLFLGGLCLIRSSL